MWGKKNMYFSQKNTGYVLEIECRITLFFSGLLICHLQADTTQSLPSHPDRGTAEIRLSEVEKIPDKVTYSSKRTKTVMFFFKGSFTLARNQKLRYEEVL